MATAEQLSVSAACRDLRHGWDVIGDTILIEQRGQIRHFARTLRCFRCETERIDEYKISDFALQRVRTRYNYIEGYHIKGGVKVADVAVPPVQGRPDGAQGGQRWVRSIGATTSPGPVTARAAGPSRPVTPTRWRTTGSRS